MLRPDQIQELRSLASDFVDFEASGLAQTSYPIEIGIYGGEGREYGSLIRPEKGWEHWCTTAQGIHKIERQRLFDEGQTVSNVVSCINDLFANSILWADSDWDSFWMARLFSAAGVEPAFKMGNIRKIVPPHHQNDFQGMIPTEITHQALKDAIDIRGAWLKYLEWMQR
ncbi:hypothetical protein ACYPKM_04770 [Pseudomonas aeruginosa]